MEKDLFPVQCAAPGTASTAQPPSTKHCIVSKESVRGKISFPPVFFLSINWRGWGVNFDQLWLGWLGWCWRADWLLWVSLDTGVREGGQRGQVGVIFTQNLHNWSRFSASWFSIYISWHVYIVINCKYLHLWINKADNVRMILQLCIV